MKVVVVSLAFTAVAVTVPDLAFAYLDPSTGSMMAQAAIAAVAMACSVVKMYWKQILALFKH